MTVIGCSVFPILEVERCGLPKFSSSNSNIPHNTLSLPENNTIKHLIVIAGPTASGKTGLSVSLAKYFNCSVVSADSRQFYKEMRIGTAKPSAEEMQNIPHFFVDTHSIRAPLSAGQFAGEAQEVISELFTQSDFVVLVGGSGLFIKALIEGIDDLPGDEEVRQKWNDLFRTKGIEVIQQELARKDPEYAKIVDQSNPVRLIRALEIIELTGQKYSVLRRGKKKVNTFQTHYFIVNHEREKLYRHINQRVDCMIQQGLEEEARDLFRHRDNQALNTVGYKELFDFFSGETSKEEAIAQIKQNTRRYAKRQITWFKSIEGAIWGTPEELFQRITKKFKGI